jgi:hypothetical protein
MVRSNPGLLAVFILSVGVAAGGCTPKTVLKVIGEDTGTTLVPPSPDNTRPGPEAPATARQTSYAPADKAIAFRLDMLGRKILAANPHAGLQPVFIPIGEPQLEVFHKGLDQIYVSEGLIKKSASEAQLAAVLCRELGRMVSEREALASVATRDPDRGPPPEVSFGNAGQIDAADQVRYAELAKLSPRRRRTDRPLPPPDPTVLAHLYLKNAGYREADLEEAAPLLAQANSTYQAEQFIKPASGAAQWSPSR